MKKVWLFVSLLLSGLLLTWCFEKVQNCIWWEPACTREVIDEEQSYTDTFKLDLSPIVVYSWYAFSWKIVGGPNPVYGKWNPWELKVYSGIDNNYVYEITYSVSDNPFREWDTSIPPITVSFLSNYFVTKDVIKEKQDMWAVEINWLDFLHILDNNLWIWSPYSSWVIDLHCRRSEINDCSQYDWSYQCVNFPTWSWTLAISWDYFIGDVVYYNYVNHLSETVSWHPWSYTYANNTYVEAGKYCYVEIWKPSDLEPLPFKFWKWFENVVVTLTKDINWWTECRDNLDWIAHDYAIKIITDKLVCDLWINENAKLLEISMPDIHARI